MDNVDMLKTSGETDRTSRKDRFSLWDSNIFIGLCNYIEPARSNLVLGFLILGDSESIRIVEYESAFCAARR